ncbi:hypothetical protein ARMSODRAFT_991083 [Armillaria solidipes]|uniref:CxC2-like cysteine cluster KDZ transposase-associated domain-containing protein n=1 Tax=Armillaria solidipes TaxID=1076256 RepID=A0A2H3B9I7_9AGAR|nr:hypothetical protein ARMSODRAFT_991083 [Armillaria solidipes]
MRGTRKRSYHIARADDYAAIDPLAVSVCTVHITGHRRRIQTSQSNSTVVRRIPNRNALESIHVPLNQDDADAPMPAPVATQKKAGRNAKSDRPLCYWVEGVDGQGFRQETLLEFMRLEGRGDFADNTRCSSCRDGSYYDVAAGEALFRCEECLGTVLECQSCVVTKHQRLPFHIIQRWSGDHFEKISLRDLGLRLQLGHGRTRCVVPRPAHSDFTVLHTNGIHKVAVDFCFCEERIPACLQLLRAELFPSTVDEPRTCATFRLLEHYQAMSQAGKISAYEYYQGLVHMTDATGMHVPKPRYKNFIRMIRQFAHIKLLKYAGRGNVPDGIATTAPGGLALHCPACPIPGVNLPPNWQSAPPDLQFLYLVVLAIDANFRLKNLFRSSQEKDPGLHTGLAYFVDPGPYLEHVRKYATQKDVSTCSGFRTLADAESKNSVGLRATGVGMCICARHELVRPLAVGDLQKGERYCNMDYIALSAARSVHTDNILFSYDIACQWKLHFMERMRAFAPAMHLPPSKVLRFGIPKCHCKGHKRDCQCEHSMNIQVVGQTDGEGIERTWSEMNVCANSTKEMGPGHRFDKLDDQFARHNWRKLIGLGEGLYKKLEQAELKTAKHGPAHNAFTAILPDEHLAAQWTEEVEAWERDPSLPTPYFAPEARTYDPRLAACCSQVFRCISGHCQARTARGRTPSVCISLGLEIEERQRRLRQEVADLDEDTLTVSQALELQKKRRSLQKRIRQLRVGLADVECHELCLPSALEKDLRVAGCLGGVAGIEEQLREAQCLDALAEIRNMLQTRHNLYSFRNKNVRGQRNNTRAYNNLHHLDRNCRLSVEKYQVAWAALMELRGSGEWVNTLRQLKMEDVQSLQGSVFEIDNEEEQREAQMSKKQCQERAKGFGEGDRLISWIWLGEGGMGDGNDATVNQEVRVEWLKSWARANQWREEVLLLKEEMRRTRAALRSTASDWATKMSGWEGMEADMSEGVRAYAPRQRALYCTLEAHFTGIWMGKGVVVDAPESDADSDDDAVEGEEMQPSVGVASAA